MGGHLATPADWITTGRKYKTRPERGVKKISGASPLPREGPEARGGSEGGASPLSESRTQVLQAFGISRGHCAMKLAEGLGEEGRAELAHDRAAPVMAYGMAEKDSWPCEGNRGCKWLCVCLGHARHRVCGYPGPGWTKVCDARMRAVGQSEKKHTAFPIGDGEKQKARNLSKKKGPAMGLEPTWV